jgi:periplasmic protein TonB
MFEDSTFESNGKIRTRSRGWMIATLALNATIALVLILIPLFYPEALPGLTITMLMQALPQPVEEPKAIVHIEHAATSSASAPNDPFIAPLTIPRGSPTADVPEPSGNPTWIALGSEGSGGGNPDGVFHGSSANPTVVQAQVGLKHISSGVAIGLLIRKVTPEYPSIARTIRLGGTVVLQATISKSGSIENLRVMSGPALLQQAAVDAVRQWRYRPYLLNGEPVEVETTVNVEFTLQ